MKTPVPKLFSISDATIHRAALGSALTHLRGCVRALCGHIREEKGDAWMWRESDENESPLFDARAAAATAISDLEYRDNDDARATRHFPGIVMLSQHGLDLARSVNHAKEALYKVSVEIGEGTVLVEGEAGPLRRPLKRVALEGFGSARLLLNHATRALIVLEEIPEAIGFTWSHTRQINRLTVKQAQDRLNKTSANASMVEKDLNTLGAIDNDEMLAFVRTAPELPKVNLGFRTEEGWRRELRHAALPLILLGTSLPKFSRLGPRTGKPTKQRLQETEATALLQSLPIYRYTAASGKRRNKGRDSRLQRIETRIATL